MLLGGGFGVESKGLRVLGLLGGVCVFGMLGGLGAWRWSFFFLGGG